MKKTVSAILAATTLLALCACSGEGNGTSAPVGSSGKPGMAGASPTQTTLPGKITTPGSSTDANGSDPALEEYDLYIPYGKAEIDGNREDAWDSAVKVPIDQVKKDTPSKDVQAFASAMWDEDGLYFLFEITDSDVFQTGTKGDYNIDGIYLYVSEDVDTTCNSFESFANGVYQFALISKEMEMLPRKGVESEVQGAQSAYTVTETGLLIEFCYKPSIFPVAAGNELLIDYQYNDASSAGTRNGGLGWYNGSDTNSSPFLWGIAKLLAKGENAPAQESE